jgi:hypothetical protein
MKYLPTSPFAKSLEIMRALRYAVFTYKSSTKSLAIVRVLCYSGFTYKSLC